MGRGLVILFTATAATTVIAHLAMLEDVQFHEPNLVPRRDVLVHRKT